MSEAFIQWKGTDVCMDFWCDCLDEQSGDPMHFDGYTFGHVLCPRCGAVWELDAHPAVRRSDRDPVHVGAVLSTG